MATRGEQDPYDKTPVVLLRSNANYLSWLRCLEAQSFERDFDPTQFASTENKKVSDPVPVDEAQESARGREPAPTYVQWDKRDRKFAGSLL
jgi:hypothetical protein